MRYFLSALSFISIIPVPQRFIKYDNDFHKIVGYFPLVGAFLGLLSFFFYYSLSIFFSKNISFMLSIFFYHFLNGGLHLDGYADFADAFFGAKKDKSKFREILKDSRIGAMGTFALFLYFSIIIKISDILIPDIKTFIFLGMAGRVTIVNSATFSKSLFEEGLGKFFIEKVGMYEFAFGNLSFFLIAIIFGWKFLLFAIFVFVFSFLFKYLIIKLYGGFSGDLFGAGCIITEILIILAFTKV